MYRQFYLCIIIIGFIYLYFYNKKCFIID